MFFRISRRPRPSGHVDHFSHGVLYGWAWNPANPLQRLNVDVFVDRCFVGQFQANSLRIDLKEAGIGDGRYGFKAHIPDEWATGTAFKAFTVFTSFPERERLDQFGECATSANSRSTKSSRLDHLREMFQPLVEMSIASDSKTRKRDLSITAPTKHRLFETLMGSTPVAAQDPMHGHRLCAYTDHIRHKYGMHDSYDTSFAPSEFDGYLKWYLEHYAAAKGTKRAPLSLQEITYLNSTIKIDSSHEISRVMSLFAPDDFDKSFGSKKLSLVDYDHLIYWWVIEESRQLFVEDCLVTNEQLYHLSSVVNDDTLSDYPLSRFIKIFISKNSLFNGLKVDQIEDRKLIYFILLIYALRLPYIIDFMPNHWVAEIFKPRKPNSLIGDFLLTMFGTNCGLLIESRIRQLTHEGQENDRESSIYEGHRIFAVSLPKPRPPQVDVQIIGPFQRVLGLGQSCRTLAKLIKGLGYHVNLYDFDLQNMSQVTSFEDNRLDHLRSARINILHLNAETLPAAIAYLPDVFSDAVNIGFCYWELPTPAQCQLLGLALPDEIWVASNYVAKSFRPFCKSVVNVGMCFEKTVRADRQTARAMLCKYGVTEADFVFLHVSDALSGVARKNPLAAIRAFTAAFPYEKNLRLIIKTHNIRHVTAVNQRKLWTAIAEVVANDTRIILIDETLPYDEHQNLIAASDCLVSLHRSEGFGLDLLNALANGISVMATAYSGNLDFCDPESTWLVAYDEVFLNPSDYAFTKAGDTWADPRHEVAISVMREIYTNEPKRRQMAENGRYYVERNFSPEIISRRIDLRLKTILSN